jgi:hypothetical protein
MGTADISTALGDTGVIAGLVAGSTTISYAYAVMCGTEFATWSLTVDPMPDMITGTMAVCEGDFSLVTSTTPGGLWYSSVSTVASIDSFTGIVTGTLAGLSTIDYVLPTGCFSAATFIVNPLPSVYFVTGGGSYCSGGSGVPVGISSSDPGIDYQLYNGGPIGAPVSGIGGAMGFGIYSLPGTYTVSATDGITGCASGMAGTATVTIDPSAMPAVSIFSSADSVCSGTPVTFTASPFFGGLAPGHYLYLHTNGWRQHLCQDGK